MSAASVQQPIIPPRPSRSTEKEENTNTSSLPKIPPRPIKRFDRSISPNPDRFAPSPLNESPFSKSPKATRSSPSNGFLSSEPVHRPASVSMPSVGEEGNEYDVVNEGLAKAPASPEHTRFAAEDLKLHAPKPTMSAQSAKQRVQAVTRTDSDKAASFGIGKPSSDETRPSSLRKKASSSQMSQKSESVFGDEEHGIPEIGQRVPMNPHLGDVQAPSPAPGSAAAPESLRSGTPRHHSRKHSSRGVNELPPGSYGLHGHSSALPTDKFEKAWYDKHPDTLKKDCSTKLHDRQNDFAMSSSDLNKIVHDTHSRGSGMGTHAEYAGTPSEEVGYHASEEYTSRMSSPRPASRSPELQRIKSPLSPLKDSHPDIAVSSADNADDSTVHVDESHNRRKSFISQDPDQESKYNAPILADDEREKDVYHPYDLQPAVEPPPERSGSAFEMEKATSRPTSRPTSIYNNQSQTELASTPLEDVEEYEPLFPDEEAKKAEAEANSWKPRHKFPSKDVWEDAPDSVNYTAEVSTPEPAETERPSSRRRSEPRTETPAHAFARKQEELAEQEARGLDTRDKKPVPLPLQQTKEQDARPAMANRFPSRDVWEDTPESLMHEAVVDTPEPAEDAPTEKPQIPSRPQKKGSESSATSERPAIPERPKSKQTPPISEKPKPTIPARPTKTLPSGTDSKEQDAAPKQKPAVPARPVGGKIAALQSTFMSDLNKRLQLGPQAPKKEEPPAADMVEEKEKALLSDARKGRARGPQRRAPAKAATPVVEAKSSGPTLSFSPLRICWSIGDSGVLEVDNDAKPEDAKATPEAEVALSEPKEAEPVATENTKIEEVTAKEETPSQKPIEEDKAEAKEETPAEEKIEAEAPKEEVKTLAANMAGEPVVEATIEEKKDEVEPVAVKQTGGEEA
ncbi:hypothetical protein CGCF415_v007444 [Colletotrichum fructicola]|nr:uncharacterized protein CGMCC3_g2792 [Colletotrichum fructicola]KAI8282076.1 hypothetical protein K4K60_003742 [Colletotrichum sp. SAR11_57]KAE9581279.1 hypothetical protein CGMCC3_g2792 [Colletotrichum fructicola]KAF4895701.1 hypothetical protein CGCFRS4_v005921 [Colletotrichum fructicola]KAF4907306.1 hypothetical protein CGCF415_v007444 [Colletotrichum fructicola]KAF4935639.1 hypothetical protein CGCF245_v007457 [Colletotrichum fructicola]